MKFFKQLLLSCSLLLAVSNVAALPSVNGTLQMAGAFNAIDENGDITTDASLTVAIDFDYWGLDKFRVTGSDGNFSGLTGGLGDITDFQFAPFAGPITDFWSIGIFSFELTNITRTNNSSTFIDLQGSGVIDATGFENTFADWTFSGGSSGGGVFSWSATADNAGQGGPTPITEPGILALLSLGLIALGASKKKYR